MDEKIATLKESNSRCYYRRQNFRVSRYGVSRDMSDIPRLALTNSLLNRPAYCFSANTLEVKSHFGLSRAAAEVGDKVVLAEDIRRREVRDVKVLGCDRGICSAPGCECGVYDIGWVSGLDEIGNIEQLG